MLEWFLYPGIFRNAAAAIQDDEKEARAIAGLQGFSGHIREFVQVTLGIVKEEPLYLPEQSSAPGLGGKEY